MQETAVSFEPMYEGQLPWFVKLFVMYLAAALLASLLRAARLIWRLRNLRKIERDDAGGVVDADFSLSWNIVHAKTASTKSLSAMTFLLSILVSAWRMMGILNGLSREKVTGTAFLAGAAAEVLTVFSLGIFVCTVVYAVAFLCETELAGCKLRTARFKEHSPGCI